MVDSGQFQGVLEREGRALGVDLTADQATRLTRYFERVAAWQPRVRLVGDLDPGRFAVRHVLDSLLVLQAAPELSEASSLLDIGSGAGLPGIPLAVLLPELSVRLVEPDGRKAAFLKDAVARLGLTRVTVHRTRCTGRPEEEGLEAADAVVSRAFAAPERWLPLARAYVSAGGTVLALMARVEDEPGLTALGSEHGLSWVRTWRGRLPGDAGPRATAVFRSDVPRGTPPE